MSPYDLKILLHYYASYEDYADNAQIRLERIQRLADVDLLERAYKDGSDWKITERGKFYVEYILALPLPIMTFKIEETK